MYCDSDIIEVNENYRLKVELDLDADNPLDWGQECEIIPIDNYRIWMGWETPDATPSAAAYWYHYLVRHRNWTPEQRDRAMRLYMNLIGDTRIFEFQEWNGYSKGDWETVLVLWGEETGANVYETWAAWRRGDVYTVVEQVRKVYVSTDDPDDYYEDWFDGDTVSGCYLDEGYTAEDAARDYFPDFPEQEED